MTKINQNRRAACQWLAAAASLTLLGCAHPVDAPSLSALADQTFAVPSGTAADALVLSRFPNAKFRYYPSALEAALAVQAGQAQALAYDEPILKNIAAQHPGLMVLPEMITRDQYGFGVRRDNPALKGAIDEVVAQLKHSGDYAAMQQRWLPRTGAPAAMPNIPLTGKNGVLRLGTAAITEPFSFVDGAQQVVGFDIELARRVAQHQGQTLEIVNMDFGQLIPALMAGQVDMIAACITITEARAKQVLFSMPYYDGGIAVLVRQPRN